MLFHILKYKLKKNKILTLLKILVKWALSQGNGGGCGVGGTSESPVESRIASIYMGNLTVYSSSSILWGISVSLKFPYTLKV
jgi:hypothetical protein